VLCSKTCGVDANRSRLRLEGICPQGLIDTLGARGGLTPGELALRMRIGPLVTFPAAFADLALKAGLRGASRVHHATAFAFP
jgi:hypothetical protein